MPQKINMLQDSFEYLVTTCELAKEDDCILWAFINPFLHSEEKPTTMPSDIQLEPIEFKTNSMLKRKFDDLPSVTGASGVINS